MPGFGLAEVIRSECAGFAPGDIVEGTIGWQEFAAVDGAKMRLRAAEETLLGWSREGRLKAPVHLFHGLESTPAALIALLAGENRGKAAVKLGN